MKSNIVSELITNICPSATRVFADKAKEFRNNGIDIISFATGEPDFDTPENITKAANQAIKDKFTRYTTTSGINELKEAICDKLRKENDLSYNTSQIIVTNGAKQALYNVFMAICNPGDEVLLPTPCWVTFSEQIKLSRAKPVFIPTKIENNFEITLDDLKSSYSSKTKVLLLNNPNNPSGAVYKLKDLFKIADFLIEKNIWVITDEIYEKIIFDNVKHVSLASLSKKIANQTITINGLSKTFAMTGWRVGWAAGPEEIINAMIKLQQHSTSCVNSISQKAAVEALTGPQAGVEIRRKEYKGRRNYMVEKLNSIKGIFCNKPQGAFYVFPNVAQLYGLCFEDNIINNEEDLANYLLDRAHVAVVPGSAFHYPDHIRLTFATSMENIIEGLNRIKLAINNLKF